MKRTRERMREVVKGAVSSGRHKSTGKLACVANQAKGSQALVSTPSRRQTGSMLTQPLPLSLILQFQRLNTDTNGLPL